MVKKYDKDDISPCPECHCMTKSIRLGRANYKCGKCGADKSLSDVFFYEATHKMHKITKEEAKDFVLKQNYEIILSTKLSNYIMDANSYDTIYFPISKEEFIKEIQEEEIVWTSGGEILGYWDDWEEVLEILVQSSEETEEEFCLFCVERNINWKDYVDESDLSNSKGKRGVE